MEKNSKRKLATGCMGYEELALIYNHGKLTLVCEWAKKRYGHLSKEEQRKLFWKDISTHKRRYK